MASVCSAQFKWAIFYDYFQIFFMVLLGPFWSLNASLPIHCNCTENSGQENTSKCLLLCSTEENHMVFEKHYDRTFISQWTIPFKIQGLMQKATESLYSILQKGLKKVIMNWEILFSLIFWHVRGHCTRKIS